MPRVYAMRCGVEVSTLSDMAELLKLLCAPAVSLDVQETQAADHAGQRSGLR